MALLGDHNAVGPEVLKLFKKIRRQRKLCSDAEEKLERYIQQAAFDTLKVFSISEAHIGTSPSSQSSQVFGYAGAVPVVTANRSSNGIVWAVEGSFGGTLHAYDASNLAIELYNSQMEGSRDALGSFLPFSVLTIANGRVYVGTANALVVFGLLNQSSGNWR